MWPEPWSQNKMKQLRNPGELHEIRKKKKSYNRGEPHFFNQLFTPPFYCFSSIPSPFLSRHSPFNQSTTLPLFSKQQPNFFLNLQLPFPPLFSCRSSLLKMPTPISSFAWPFIRPRERLHRNWLGVRKRPRLASIVLRLIMPG